ncbi:putative enzyme related to lactoylglutathione lyase [Lentzea atacamensis]|uniref:Enzyme related to lactoylglutathione lyase n=3 Tax=Pseudonocardiaceae TaxID=2070 RepID=A0ABX9EKX4_9PSEU|nr:putative enzyme related to lactoylglutathione lyase [Lentzea atacamensis]
MLRGMSTVTYYADDLEAARAWYTSFLGIEAYFEGRTPEGELGYVEFRLGDYLAELGLAQRKFEVTPSDGPAGAILFWAVDDLEATFARLHELGAKTHDEPRVRGEGYVTASVVDPFGNILGIMTNVHYTAVAKEFAERKRG